MIDEHRVQCNICGENFRATPSHINLICKGCFKNKEKEIIADVIKELKNYWKEYYWIILETKEEVISKEHYDELIEKYEKTKKEGEEN